MKPLVCVIFGVSLWVVALPAVGQPSEARVPAAQAAVTPTPTPDIQRTLIRWKLVSVQDKEVVIDTRSGGPDSTIAMKPGDSQEVDWAGEKKRVTLKSIHIPSDSKDSSAEFAMEGTSDSYTLRIFPEAVSSDARPRLVTPRPVTMHTDQVSSSARTTEIPGSPLRGSDMSREERIKAHQSKIDKIIQENKEKHEAELDKAVRAQEESKHAPMPVVPPHIPEGVEKPGKSAEEREALGKFAGAYVGERKPKPAADDCTTRVRVTFAESPVLRVAGELSRQSGKSVRVRGKARDARVTILARDLPLERVLDMIVNQHPDWMWWIPEDGSGAYEIIDQGSFHKEVRYQKILPTPYPESDTSVSVTFAEAPIERVVSEIGRQSGMQIVVRGKTLGRRVTMLEKGVSVERALRSLADMNDWVIYKPEDKRKTYEIWDRESYIREVLPRKTQQRTWALASVSAAKAAQGVELILTPEVGSVVADKNYNKLMVTDLPAALEKIAAFLKSLDPEVVEVNGRQKDK